MVNDQSTGFVPVTRVAVRVALRDGRLERFEQESWLAGACSACTINVHHALLHAYAWLTLSPAARVWE